MIRPSFRLSTILLLAVTLAAPTLAAAKTAKKAAGDDAAATDAEQTTDAKTSGTKGKSAKGKDSKSGGKAAAGKPQQVGTFGDWGAFLAAGKNKTCYALAEPKDRTPAGLKRDKAYVFISDRPGENVRSEISIIMGFAMKDNSEAKAEINGTTFDLIGKGTNAWVKNPAEEGQFIETLKKGSKLIIKASSVKGNASTDSYSLTGLKEALARVRKDCP